MDSDFKIDIHPAFAFYFEQKTELLPFLVKVKKEKVDVRPKTQTL